MGLFSRFKVKDKTHKGKGGNRPPGASEPHEDLFEAGELDDASLQQASAHSPILDAIEGVGVKVEKGSSDVQKTVLQSASHQNSVIQGIYQLIDQRTMDRADLDKKRREAWKVISESLADVRMELTELSEVIKSAGLGPDVLQGLERSISGAREETQSSRQHIERALTELQQAQSARLEGALAELREVERERAEAILGSVRDRAEEILGSLREESEKSVNAIVGTVREESEKSVGTIVGSVREESGKNIDAVLESLGQRFEAILGSLREESGKSTATVVDSLRERAEAIVATLREESVRNTETVVGTLRHEVERHAGDVAGAVREESEKTRGLFSNSIRHEAERIDAAVDELRQQTSRRIDETKRVGDLRVFDAIRGADERVAQQREIQREKLNELAEEHRRDIARLETRLGEVVAENARGHRETLFQMIGNLDALEARLTDAEDALAERERVVAGLHLERQDGEGAPEEKGRVSSFFEKILPGRERNREREERIDGLELSLLETLRSHKTALEDLRRSMLDSLKREGVEQLHTVGEQFDPTRHIKVDEVEGEPSGRILRERRRGYVRGEEVLRLAEVVVVR